MEGTLAQTLAAAPVASEGMCVSVCGVCAPWCVRACACVLPSHLPACDPDHDDDQHTEQAGRHQAAATMASSASQQPDEDDDDFIAREIATTLNVLSLQANPLKESLEAAVLSSTGSASSSKVRACACACVARACVFIHCVHVPIDQSTDRSAAASILHTTRTCINTSTDRSALAQNTTSHSHHTQPPLPSPAQARAPSVSIELQRLEWLPEARTLCLSAYPEASLSAASTGPSTTSLTRAQQLLLAAPVQLELFFPESISDPPLCFGSTGGGWG
jgi:hypothetical protein